MALFVKTEPKMYHYMKKYISFCLFIVASLLVMAQPPKADKGDYAKFETEEVSEFRQHFPTFQMPSVSLPKEDPVMVDKWKKVEPYFADGKKVHTDIPANVARFVAKHKEVVSRTTEMEGYRVQVYIGIEREAANQAKGSFVSKFPGVSNDLLFIEPSYRIRAGAFLTRSEAEDFCKQARRNGFPSAFVVREAKVKIPKLRPISVSGGKG